MTEMLTLLKFLTDNFGAVAGIFILIALAPAIIIFYLMRTIGRLQDTCDDKLDRIENSTLTLAEYIKSSLEMIKWFLKDDKGGEKKNDSNTE